MRGGNLNLSTEKLEMSFSSSPLTVFMMKRCWQSVREIQCPSKTYISVSPFKHSIKGQKGPEVPVSEARKEALDTHRSSFYVLP